MSKQTPVGLNFEGEELGGDGQPSATGRLARPSC